MSLAWGLLCVVIRQLQRSLAHSRRGECKRCFLALMTEAPLWRDSASHDNHASTPFITLIGTLVRDRGRDRALINKLRVGSSCNHQTVAVSCGHGSLEPNPV